MRRCDYYDELLRQMWLFETIKSHCISVKCLCDGGEKWSVHVTELHLLMCILFQMITSVIN